MLALSPRELLTTTRAVRKRLDLTKLVEREVIEECIAIAQQATTASNMQNWHFVAVTDSDKKAALAELYRKGQEIYLKQPTAVSNVKFDDPKRNATQERITSSGKYLVEHLKEVPVHVIPCIEARTEGQPIVVQSAVLAMEKEELLNRYFNDITEERVESEEAWNRISNKPRLWNKE